MRDMLLISHANPEDNAFTRWLALRLSAAGYPVWCDLTKLLGGERFWDDIEDAIRNRTAKFLFVLSRDSNGKPGPRNELSLALNVQRRNGLKDFIIPLLIDSLPTHEFNVELTSINAITAFRESWAAGLAQLLAKLEDAGVAKGPAFGAEAVTSWWRRYAITNPVLSQSEPLISNWYALRPTQLYFHELARKNGVGPLRPPRADLPQPAVVFNQYLVSFAPAGDFEAALGPLEIRDSVARTVNPPSDSPGESRLWSFKDERSVMTQLLREAWRRFAASRGLSAHAFANDAQAFYFRKGQIAEDRIWFTGYDGKPARRDVIGYKTLKGPDGMPRGIRYWHFALEARPTSHPFIGYTMKPHVIFSDDGQTIWHEKERMHRARRSQCKAWWNDKWRDLIAATVWWLADGEGAMQLPGGAATPVPVSSTPLLLDAPVSYDESAAHLEDAEYMDDDFIDDAGEFDEAEIAGDEAMRQE